MNSTRGLLADTVAASCVDGPGNRFVAFLQGCSFDCVACHNPHTIPARQVGSSHFVTVEQLIEEIRLAAPFISGVTVSGGEATCQWQFVEELFHELKHDPELSARTTFVDSNGDADPFVWDTLAPWMDAAMIDLKALDPDAHRLLTGHSNERVLASISHLAVLGKLYEVRLLLVPGVNDGAAWLGATADLLLAVDPHIRVKLIAFRRHGTRRIAGCLEEATDEDIARARTLLEASGIRHITRA